MDPFNASPINGESFGTQSQGAAVEPILRSVLDGDILRRPTDALMESREQRDARKHTKGPCDALENLQMMVPLPPR
jgi:hypothetical protein